MPPATESLLVALVSLLIGGLGIYVAAWFLVGARDYGHAVVTAGLGALAWAVVSALLDGYELLGPALTLLAYLGVIKWRYRTGWLTAAGVALVAWVAALLVLELLASLDVTGYSALGIPRT